MKLRHLLLPILAFIFVFSCEDDDEILNGTGVVDFSLTEIVEVENATSSLTLNIGVDTFNHNGGTVDVSISGADYGTDYITSTESSTFTLTVAPQSLLADFSISPVDDEVIEEDKVLTITLSNATGSLALGENTSLVFTILDNDDPLIALVGFETETSTIQENDTNNTLINIPFDQTSTNGGTLVISSSGDANFDTDYTVTGQTSGNFTLNVPSGVDTASFEIQPIDNTMFEADKTVTFTITDVTGGLAIGPDSQTTVTIVNDDAPTNPVIDFSDSISLTYNEDSGTATLNFELSSMTTADATLEITTSGTADASDFNFDGSTANPYSFTIPSGSTTASIDISITDDAVTETDETIILTITSVTGGLDAGLNLQQQTLTITDNDASPSFNYVETFESNDGSDGYLNTTLNFQNALANQTIDPTKVIELITNAGSFSDVDEETDPSDNGLNLFYNTGNDSSLNGVVDNVVITPILEGSGAMDVSIDAAYAFKNQNAAMVTFYWSQTYDGSGTFNESEWTVMGTETVTDMDNEGFGNNSYKRQEFDISPTANFYLAIRVTGTVDDTNYRLRWRFDNIKAISQ